MTKTKPPLPKKSLFISMSILIGLLLSAVLLTAGRYKVLHFGDAKIDEVIFYFLNGIEGQSSSLSETVQDNLLFLAISFFLLLIPVLDFYKDRITININLSWIGRNRHLRLNPSNIPRRLKAGYMLTVLMISVWFLTSSFGVYDYLVSLARTSQVYEQYYQDPKSAKLIFPEQKRNLIHIYLESMENTLISKQNGGQVDQPLIPELEAIATNPEVVSFSHLASGVGGMLPVNGTTWTVGGLVAQSGGVPLKNDLLGQGHNGMGAFKQFLPGAYTIGDILKDNGYNQTFVMGSVASFGGRDKLLTQHGGYTIKDYEYSKRTGQIGKDYGVWWGYEDNKLFDFAKEELTRLATEEKPFNLELLTADTHFTDGYLDASCQTNHQKRYDNVYACSSRMVSQFIDWVKTQDFYQNTTIVITGDHLGMQTAYYSDKIADPQFSRTIYNAFINPVIEPINRQERQFSSFDIFPTTLASIGVSVPNDRLALGVNLFSDQPTIIEQMGGLAAFNDQLMQRSEFYERHILTSK